VCSTIVPPAICPDLWVSQRESLDDPWEPPVLLNAAVNSPYAEFAPAFGAKGRLLFFGSDRPTGGCGSRDVWVSFRKNKKDDFGWQPPVNLGCIVNFTGFDDGPTYFDVERRGGDDRDDDEDAFMLYFTSQDRPGGLGDFDIWSTTLNRGGTFSTPVNVTELNSAVRDTRTAISKDGLEIILTSNRPGGLGLLDMWVATRSSSTAAWSTPVNLGSVVNGAANDGAPALSRDGRTLYFYSNRAGGLGANDLYVATRRKITGHDRDRD
jgi:peptidoglycan-associated lipoprotein